MRYLFWFTLFVALSLFANQATPEAIKTAYLYNFTKFIRTDKSAKELQICLYRQPEMIGSLRKLEGKSVRHKKITIHTLSDLEEIGSCTILLIPKLPESDLAKLLSHAYENRVLLISEGLDQARAGVPLCFYIENGRLRFAVNLESLRKTRIDLSSKLLRMATIVH